MFLQDECLSESADCDTEVEVCTTELVDREVCQDQEDHRIGRKQPAIPLFNIKNYRVILDIALTYLSVAFLVASSFCNS